MVFDGHTTNCATALALIFPDNTVIQSAISEFMKRPEDERALFATTVDAAALAAWLAERFNTEAVTPSATVRAWGVVSIAGVSVLAAFDRGVTWVYGSRGLSSVRGARVVGAWRLP